ncbi:MAG: hypothetical protein JSW48_11755 [Betaproteobacteria bacterium]|jgi:hypothetical protein|nr:MAG: hypothetical protein JSW48_11755 [Betaproteobacteria bacterium]
MAKKIRVAILLFVLLTVAVGTWQARVRISSWKRALNVVVFPVNADGTGETEAYIRSLDDESFDSIRTFVRNEARHYGISLLNPVDIFIGPKVGAMPPTAPVGGSAPRVMLWSLQLRFWAWRHGEHPILKPDVRIYALLYHPSTTQRLGHSVGLQKGLIGLAKLFAVPHMTAENNIVITHELLHTLGATDKYDLSNNQPVYPSGYAEPDIEPLYPQQFAEIMGARIAVSNDMSVAPRTLDAVLVGPETAREIGWR